MINYEKFDIFEVARKCGIMFKPYQREGVEMEAQCPFCNDKKYHLSINRVKERYHCFHCDAKGNSVSLYARIFGVSNRDAYESLAKNLVLKMPKKTIEKQKQLYQTPIRPLADRHAVYYDFLHMLMLTPRHRENLLGRGLELQHINQFMYRSMPLDTEFRKEVVAELSEKHDLKGIPGFFRDDGGNWQMYIKSCGGYFVPVCDHNGYIQGLQIRLDDTENRKYRWFSSSNYYGGTRAYPWIHIVGDTSAKEACLLEGALKADVTSVLSGGRLFIAVPGVNAIEYLPQVLDALQIRKIHEGFDMDKTTNIHVKRALNKLNEQIKQLGIECQPLRWNAAYKGLDDYYYHKKQFQCQSSAA